MTVDKARGQRIREAAALRNLTKVHAFAAALNVSVAAVSRWQNGGHLSLENACALADALDVSLDWLLLGRGTMNRQNENAVFPSELAWILALRRQPDRVRKIVNDIFEIAPFQDDFRPRKTG